MVTITAIIIFLVMKEWGGYIYDEAFQFFVSMSLLLLLVFFSVQVYAVNTNENKELKAGTPIKVVSDKDELIFVDLVNVANPTDNKIYAQFLVESKLNAKYATNTTDRSSSKIMTICINKSQLDNKHILSIVQPVICTMRSNDYISNMSIQRNSIDF